MPKRFWDTIDWDPALRTGNQWFDRLVATMRVKNRATRQKQFDQIEMEVKVFSKKFAGSERLALALGLTFFTKEPGKSFSKVVGDALIPMLTPAVGRLHEIAARDDQGQNNLYLAFALAAYQRDRGRYPPKLDALAPKYLPKIPVDLFSGKPLIYRPSKDGYLFYSVGVNCRDEQGRGILDDPRGDDLSVRMPLPELRRK